MSASQVEVPQVAAVQPSVPEALEETEKRFFCLPCKAHFVTKVFSEKRVRNQRLFHHTVHDGVDKDGKPGCGNECYLPAKTRDIAASTVPLVVVVPKVTVKRPREKPSAAAPKKAPRTKKSKEAKEDEVASSTGPVVQVSTPAATA